jgi:hypothetical protein
VTVPEVNIGESFQIAVPVEGYQRSCVRIDPSHIASLDQRSEESTSVALSMFRRGVSAGTPYQVLTDLWTAVEAIAEREARDRGDFVEERCPKCQTPRRTVPASQRYIREAFLHAKPVERGEEDAVSLADQTRRIRGTLVHGGRLHDTRLRQQVEEKLPALQAAAVALVKKLHVKPKSDRCQHLGVPYMAFTMIAEGPRQEDCKVVFDNFAVPAALSMLPKQFAEAQHFFVRIGLLMPVPIHPFVLPEVTGSVQPSRSQEVSSA